MSMDRRIPLIASAILFGLTGLASAADEAGKADASAKSGSQEPAGAPPTSVGAGGLTGSAATEDGSRRVAPGAGQGSTQPPRTGAPAAGTTR